jgi:hypothetical protein
VPSRGVLRVAPGGSAVLAVDVSRIDGFAESVRFEFRGLSDDFVVSSTIVGPGQTRGLLTLTAPWDAATGTLPISVVGVAAVNGARVEIVADPTPVLLTVTSAPRFTLEVAEAALVVGQGKDAWLHVGAARANGFAGPIAVSIVGLPGLARATSVTIPATERTTTVAVHAWTVPSRNPVVSVPVAGTYAISAKGSATIDGEPVTAYAPAIPITIAPAPFVVNAEPARQSFLLPAEAAADDAAVDGGTVTEAASDEPDEGMGATFTITITRQGGFSDAVDITLADLPDGLTASVASVQAGENDASITLTATAALATGEHSIRFRGSATIDGSDFAQDSQVVVIKVIR